MSQIDRARSLWLSQHVLPYEHKIRAVLASRPRAGLEIDDIVQQMYVILSSLESIDEIRNPMAYALQTAYSVIQTQVRRSRIVTFTQINEMSGASIPADPVSMEREMEAREELRLIKEIVDDLPERHRQVFVMRRILGFSHKEIADRLQMTDNTVEKLLTAALQLVTDAFKRGGSFQSRTSLSKVRKKLFRLRTK